MAAEMLEAEARKAFMAFSRAEGGPEQEVLRIFFITLVTGPRRSLTLKLSETKVYEP